MFKSFWKQCVSKMMQEKQNHLFETVLTIVLEHITQHEQPF